MDRAWVAQARLSRFEAHVPRVLGTGPSSWGPIIVIIVIIVIIISSTISIISRQRSGSRSEPSLSRAGREADRCTPVKAREGRPALRGPIATAIASAIARAFSACIAMLFAVAYLQELTNNDLILKKAGTPFLGTLFP